MLLALHREPNFEPLGTLKAGNQILITARNCQQFTYTITQVWVENPSQVTQLQPITQGHFLTLVTCTPVGGHSANRHPGYAHGQLIGAGGRFHHMKWMPTS